jgi:cyclophilin family peptidyl-prolyl cis-trans isomerase
MERSSNVRRIDTIFCSVILAAFLWAGAAGAADSAASENPRVHLKTSLGDIVIELYPKSAPKTVDNFLGYVRRGYYDGTIFHRVIKGFMIQGGGFDADMNQKKPIPPIRNEAVNKLENRRYTIAMARTSAPHSATSQFFINTVDNPRLNYVESTPTGYGYCVFGKVVEGTDVVDAIENQATESRGRHQNVPLTPVVIEKAVVE